MHYLHSVTKKYLRKFYQKGILEELKQKKKAYKVLETYTPARYKKRIPSRVNRGILEVAGRILRTVNDRRKLFDFLVQTMGENPKKWSYKKIIENYHIYIKSQYITNLAEQTEKFFREHGEYPKDFWELQSYPKIGKPMISYAPDDGQAIRMKLEGEKLLISLKVITDESAYGKPEWEWIDFVIPLPHFLQPCSYLAPDLRLVKIHGKELPVLDYKIEIDGKEKNYSSSFITVDWGTRKLLTLCVFNQNGTQISPPIFLKFEPVQKKLLRIRKEIDHLKSIRDSLYKHSSLWEKYQREIDKRWRKFRAVQKELAHLASNVIIIIAQLYNCSAIYFEWLKSLKSQKYNRNLNWIINTTIREAIFKLVSYKGKLVGIELKKPLPPYHTSQRCPRCGKRGFHTKSPDQKTPIKSGSWFLCPSCGFNADRDYVACCNLARRALYGNLNDHTKVIAYTAKANSDLLFRQSAFPRERLRRHLSGWKEVVSLTPQRIFCGTLRS